MNEQSSKRAILVGISIAMIASIALYYIGWTETPDDSSNRATIIVTSVDVISGDTATNTDMSTATPVVVPAKDLNIIPSKKRCVIGGCSGEICASEEMMSNCIYKPEFACYKNATCKEQPSGECGWSPTAELNQCLNTERNTLPEI